MIEVECPPGLRAAVEAAAQAAGLSDGHLSVELVDEERITELNTIHRGRNEPTDVLSFPVDGSGPALGPREIGDVVICPARADDLKRAAIHGVLHLAGLDHEADHGEMLALEQRIVDGLGTGG